MTLFKASLLTATAAVTLAAAATSVQATVYYWSYTLTNGQGAGSGAFTVNGALPSAITAESGAITSDPVLTTPATVVGINYDDGSDETLYATGNTPFSYGGVTVALSTGDEINFYCAGADNCAIQEGSAGNFSYNNSANFNVAVPEPFAWTLMLVGFAGLGVALRNRRRAGAAIA
jgi:hypothetical protein